MKILKFLGMHPSYHSLIKAVLSWISGHVEFPRRFLQNFTFEKVSESGKNLLNNWKLNFWKFLQFLADFRILFIFEWHRMVLNWV